MACLGDVDVAAAGGWKDTVSLKRAYQQADADTILSVVPAQNIAHCTPQGCLGPVAQVVRAHA